MDPPPDETASAGAAEDKIAPKRGGAVMLIGANAQKRNLTFALRFKSVDAICSAELWKMRYSREERAKLERRFLAVSETSINAKTDEAADDFSNKR